MLITALCQHCVPSATLLYANPPHSPMWLAGSRPCIPVLHIQQHPTSPLVMQTFAHLGANSRQPLPPPSWAGPCQAMPGQAMPCRARPCHLMPCQAVPGHAMPSQASIDPNPPWSCRLLLTCVQAAGSPCLLPRVPAAQKPFTSHSTVWQA